MWESNNSNSDVSATNETSTKAESIDFSALTPAQETHISTGTQEQIALNTIAPLSGAEFSQNGQDLMIQTDDGRSFTLHDYFSAPMQPSISNESGHSLSAEMINPFIKNKSYATAEDDQIMSDANDSPAIGQVTEISGDVTITRLSGETITAEKGTIIHQGDIVETADSGALNIMFADESSFAISNNARMTIDEFIFDASSMEGISNFSMLQGVFVYTSGEIGAKDPDDVKIKTPIGSIGIRGTIIAGDIQQDGTSKITVVEGAIYVRNDSGEQVLSQQFETVEIRSGEGLIDNIGKLSPSQVLQNTQGVHGVAGVFTHNIEALNDGSGDNAPQAEAAPNGTAGPDAPPPKADAPQNIQSEDGAPLAPPPLQTAPPPPKPTLLDEQKDGLLDGTSTEFKLATLDDGAPLSGTTTTTTQTAPPPLAPPPPKVIAEPPPPSVIDGSSKSSGSVATPTHINLNNAETLPKVHVISGMPDGAQYGSAIEMVYNTSNGFDDLVLLRGSFSNGNTSGNYVTVNGNANLSASFDLSGATYYDITDNGTDNTSAERVTSVTSGDFDGDGTNELLIGAANGYTPNTTENDGFTYVKNLNGTDGTQYANYSGIASGDGNEDYIGYSISNVGDLNNDGHVDIAIAAPGRNLDQGFVRLELVGADLGDTPSPINYEGSTGQYIGGDVTALGDINGDGYDDFAFGVFDGTLNSSAVTSNLNSFFIIQGGKNPLNYDEILEAKQIDGGTGFGRYVEGVGDVNGDGLSDVLVSNGETSLKLLMGQSSISDGNVSGFTNQFTIDVTGSGYNIEGAGSIGDFNADGHDDFIVMMRNGTDIKMSIIMGSPNLNGVTANLQYLLDNPDMNLMINYTLDSLPAGKYHLEFTGGDMNGDGFDDVIISDSENNTAFIVEGRGYGDNLSNYIKGNSLNANIDYQMMTGTALNDTFIQNNKIGLVAHGGAGQDTFVIDKAINGGGAGFHQVDGGGGDNDVLRLAGGQGSIDFTLLTQNNVQRIESIEVGNGNDLTLSVKQIFDMLKSSDNGELKITALGAGQTLEIKSGDDPSDDMNGLAAALETLTEATGIAPDGASMAGYQRFEIGNYSLYVDDDFAIVTTQAL